LPPKCINILKEEKAKGNDVVPKKIGLNRWRQLRRVCGLTNVGTNVGRRTAISNFYRHNPLTGKPVTDESIISEQFGNTKDIR